MTFDVTVIDPCRTTAIVTVDITAGMTLELGDTASLDFLEAQDAVSISTDLPAICGTMSYVVVDPSDSNNAVSWISIAAKVGSAGTYTITASPILETFVGTQTYNLYTTLDDYDDEHSHPGRTDTLTIIVQAATCDCSAVVRDQPSIVTHNGAVSDGGTSVAIPAATINQANSEAINPKIRMCYTSSGCANTATYAVTLSDNSNLPSFMVSDGTNIAVTPTDGLEVDTYTIKVVMTPTYGAVETYDGITVIITCTIASINDVAAPNSGLQYILYDTTHSVDLSGNLYTQTPPCKYSTTNTFAWTIDGSSPITVNSANSQQIDIISLDRSKVGTHSVTMTADFAYGAQSFTETDTISFDVEIIDPCETTTINDAVFSPSTLTVVNGATATMTFTEVTDSVEVSNNIDTLCQGRTYTLLKSDLSAADFITLTGAAGGPYTITAAPTLDAEVGSWTYKLKTELTAYPGNSNSPHYTDIPVVVTGAACDQNGLEWLSTA